MTKLGLIGVGRWGKNYIKTIDKMTNISIEALCCRTPSHAYESGIQEVNYYSDNYKDFIKFGLDGVIICTPPNTHFEMLNYFLDHNISILVEKPITLSLNNTLAIEKKMIQEGYKVLLVGLTQVYNPAFNKLVSIWDNFPKEDLFIKSEGTSYGPFRKDYSLLYDRLPHDVSMCMDFFKKMPKWVECLANHENTFYADYITVKLHFPKNCDVLIDISNVIPYKRRNFIVSYKKSSDLSLTKGGTILEDKDLKFFDGEAVPVDTISPLENTIKEFVNGIKLHEAEGVGVTNIDLALQVDQIIDACQKSIDTGKRIYL